VPTPVTVIVDPAIDAGPEGMEYVIAPVDAELALTVNGATP
jgi:hypothetical protein